MVFTTGFDSASQLKKITNKDIVVQPSGVKKIFYEAYNKRFRKSSVQVITVANLFEKKNINMVLDIAKELPKINFLVVGDGPERFNLSNRIVNENIQNVVILENVEEEPEPEPELEQEPEPELEQEPEPEQEQEPIKLGFCFS